MNQPKLILISTISASLLVLAGCTQTGTNTNTNVVTNTNTVNDNANVEVVANTNATVDNENTNTSDENGEVDAADLSSGALAQEDWLTYTNEEYGLVFEYPDSNNITESTRDDITYITPLHADTTFDTQVMVASADIIGDESICGVFPASEEEFGGIKMKKIIITEGTGPECNAPMTGYVFQKGGLIYKIIFYDVDQFEKLHRHFLDSFHFTS